MIGKSERMVLEYMTGYKDPAPTEHFGEELYHWSYYGDREKDFPNIKATRKSWAVKVLTRLLKRGLVIRLNDGQWIISQHGREILYRGAGKDVSR